MEKQYEYRKHIKKMRKIMPIILGCLGALFFIIILAIVAINNITEPVIIGVFLFVGLFIAVIFALEAIFIWVFFGRFVKVRVTLTEDYIIYRNVKGETIIPIDQIQRVEFSSIKYTGGWLKIVYPGGNIRMTVVIERIGDFLHELKTILDRKGRANVYNPKAMFGFYKTAEFADQSWDRLKDVKKRIILFMIINVLVGGIFGFYISKVVGVLLAVVSLVMPLLMFSVSEFTIATRIAKKSNEQEFVVADRDRDFENKVYKTVYIIYSIVYLILLVGIFIINILG